MAFHISLPCWDTIHCSHCSISPNKPYSLHSCILLFKTQPPCCSALTLAPYSEKLQCFVKTKKQKQKKKQSLHVKNVNWCFLMSLNCFTFLPPGKGLTTCLVTTITSFMSRYPQNCLYCPHGWIHDWINLCLYLQSAVKFDLRESTSYWNILIPSDWNWRCLTNSYTFCGATLTDVTPGSSLRLSWASCLITSAAGENHEKSKEWAQAGTGSWSESCNHVWCLMAGSGMCQREGSRCAGHMRLRHSVITQPRFAVAAAVWGFRFH